MYAMRAIQIVATSINLQCLIFHRAVAILALRGLSVLSCFVNTTAQTVVMAMHQAFELVEVHCPSCLRPRADSFGDGLSCS